jgi:hypothetical protein
MSENPWVSWFGALQKSAAQFVRNMWVQMFKPILETLEVLVDEILDILKDDQTWPISETLLFQSPQNFEHDLASQV